MSPTIRSHSHRPLVVAGLVGLFSLAGSVASTQAQSITPERAFLNAIPAAGSSEVAGIQPSVAVDGNRALLNQSVAGSGAVSLATRSPGAARTVDGEQALLVVPPAQRRLTLAL